MDDHFRFPPLPPLESSLIWNQMMSQENPLGNSQIPSSFSHPMNNHLPLRGQSFYFKTRICVRFKSGCCPNGDSCNFAHTFEELRRPLGNGAANRDWLPRQDYCYSSCRQNPDMSNCDVWINQSEEQKLFKNKICRKFYAGGICPYGDKCSFLHVEPGSLQDSSGDHNVSSSSRQNHVHWKTKLCHKWSTSGKCPYGGQCNHAHGDAELRKSGLKNHCEEDEKRVAAAPSKVSSCGRTDDNALPKVKKPHPISLPQPPAPITTLTLEKCKRIYGDWIDD